MDEIMDIFPSEYIHIGGDECPKNRWKVCENCQKKIADLGIQELPKHSKEEQLQTWFMGEIEKQIRNRGRNETALEYPHKQYPFDVVWGANTRGSCQKYGYAVERSD